MSLVDPGANTETEGGAGGPPGRRSFVELFAPEQRPDPYPLFEALLAQGPEEVAGFGVAFGHHGTCASILRDPARWGSDEARSAEFRRLEEAGQITPEITERMGWRPFLFRDPPDHTRLRGLVSKAFTPRVVERLRPQVQLRLDGLLADIARSGTGRCDLVTDLAYPLPVLVISEMLGVPAEDHDRFRGWSQALAKSLDPTPGEVHGDELSQAADDFRSYFRELIGQRRNHPGDDLLSGLIAAEDEGSRLTEDEMLSTCILLLVAGHETTVNLIANGILALLRHPDQLERLRQNPGLARSTVEEVLRFDPPVQFTGRFALGAATVEGAMVPDGESAILLLGAANRDPAVFAQPGRFDVGRSPNPHLSFGFGPHFCLGAALARVEGELALDAFAQRFVAPDHDETELEYRPNVVLRGLARFPLSFEEIRSPA